MDGSRGWIDPNDERDPEVAERLEERAPEALLRRREFLQRAAVTAGLGAGLASVLGPDTILDEAAARARKPVPAPPTCRSTPSWC